LPDARMVLMTAFGDEETRAEALRLGASGVLQKPFDVKGLATRIVQAHRQGAREPRACLRCEP
jgi:DNA-binding response OmpR family regulator